MAEPFDRLKAAMADRYIRVDLILIYPFLLVASAAAVVSLVRAQRGQRTK